MDVPFAQAELYITKLTASHFKALNTKIANQNVLETILIAMLNENTAVSNENLRNCCGNPYRPCTTGRLHLASWGGVTPKISLVLVHFGLIKIKTKAKYNCISNILYLLSALACIPRVEAVWASLVVISPSFSKFSFVINCCLIVD